MYQKTIKFNTEPILSEIDNVIKNGLTKLLSEHLDRYELLEKTHQAIMCLPSVLNEMNHQYIIDNSKTQFLEKEKEKEKEKEQEKKNEIDVKSIMLFTEELIKTEVDKQYATIIPLFEKMLTKIEKLTNEVNELKSKNTKDIEIEDPQEKENIKLEIDELEEEEQEEQEETDDVEEEEVVDVEEEEVDDTEEEEQKEIEVDDVEEEEETDDVEVEEEQKEIEVDDVEVSTEEDVEKQDVKIVEENENEDDVETEKSESDAEIDVEEEVNETQNVIEDAEDEYFEIDIDDTTYCTTDEENGFIYELTEDGDIGTKVGYLKDGEPFFYADEN
jgi:hypothetical protein